MMTLGYGRSEASRKNTAAVVVCTSSWEREPLRTGLR